jgi:outer membrane protein assembly factor BamB
MVSPEKGLPASFEPGKQKANSEEIDMATTKNVKWVAKVGSQFYGNPTISGGKVFVGTNNESPRDKKYEGDYSMVMCFEEATGKYLWQLAVPKLGAGKVSDWEYLGICSSPAVEGNRLYVVTNRCEVVCLDTEGMANGNDGPFKDDAQYCAGPDKPPIPSGPQDGDIIWRYDMSEELGVFPHNIASCSPLLQGDVVYTATSNGVDWSHLNLPAPRAPTLIALNKMTGELLGEEASGIGKNTMHCNWSSPAFAPIGPNGLLIFGGGDGFCHGFDPVPVKDKEGISVFKEIWRFDCNPPHYRKKNGLPVKYATREGPSEIIATPVFYKGRVYVAIGQDPEHGEGVGNLCCIDASKTGDITESGRVWTYDKINRTISTASIVDDIVYVADYAGVVHCLDAATGKVHWTHETGSHIWGSTLVADGKVYVGNEAGDLVVLAAGKEKKEIARIGMGGPVYTTPVAANGVLYVGTQSHLYAIQNK